MRAKLRRMIGTLGAVIALGSVAMPVQALSPLPPCGGVEGGMRISGAQDFGHYKSGLVVERYSNLDKGNIVGGAPGPVPALNNFSGMRITDCRSGRMVALHGVGLQVVQELSATEFLRSKVQGEKRVRLSDVEKAAKALYGQNNYVRIIKLRETEETCACREFFPGAWK
ncbi:hypothetical protein N4R57_12985 [Rhodobacteraceae bacterium D3-12]|nr:hypothetical protein N4R57_12985 [Rhodobacteraceae bacterium D3-12]